MSPDTTVLAGLNFADGMFLAALGLVVWTQWERGLILTLSDVISWTMGIFVGMNLAEWIHVQLVWGETINQSLSKVGVFFLTTVLVTYLGAKSLGRLAEKIEHQYVSGIGQLLLGSFLALIYGVILLIFVVYILDQLVFLNGVGEMIRASWFYMNLYEPIVEVLVQT